VLSYDEFYQTVERLHGLQLVPFVITYTDPEGDLLPINNNENYAVAVASARPLLRVHIQRKGMQFSKSVRNCRKLENSVHTTILISIY